MGRHNARARRSLVRNFVGRLQLGFPLDFGCPLLAVSNVALRPARVREVASIDFQVKFGRTAPPTHTDRQLQTASLARFLFALGK